MKKLFSVMIAALMIFALSSFVFAADPEPVITLQPQNYTIPAGTTAVYRVEAEGTNLRATWYIEFMGETFDMTPEMGSEQWRAYVGEGTGATRDDENENIFYLNLVNVKSELSGAKIYCEIEDGHYLVRSDSAYVTVSDGAAPYPYVGVPSYVRASLGENTKIECIASPSDASALSYVWYETPDGDLPGIMAINRGEETKSTLVVDTSAVGVRYYVCMVTTANGGVTYSSTVKVEVVDDGVASDTKILTSDLPVAESGKEYGVKLECSDPSAEFASYYNPGGANDLEKTGLTLSASGELSGVAGEVGEYTFSVTAAGSHGEDYATYTLKIVEAGSAEVTGENGETKDDETKGAGDVTGEPVVTVGAEDTSSSSALPLWVIIVMAVSGVLIGALITLIVIILVSQKKKKS